MTVLSTLADVDGVNGGVAFEVDEHSVTNLEEEGWKLVHDLAKRQGDGLDGEQHLSDEEMADEDGGPSLSSLTSPSLSQSSAQGQSQADANQVQSTTGPPEGGVLWLTAALKPRIPQDERPSQRTAYNRRVSATAKRYDDLKEEIAKFKDFRRSNAEGIPYDEQSRLRQGEQLLRWWGAQGASIRHLTLWRSRVA